MVDFSATRKTTKLAGTKDMATMMKMAMTTSVPCSLGARRPSALPSTQSRSGAPAPAHPRTYR